MRDAADDGTYGTDAQRRMQAKADRLAPWIMRTAGAVLTGRLFATDDPARLGLDVIRQHLVEDGAVGYRFLSDAEVDGLHAGLADLGGGATEWIAHVATPDEAAIAAAPIVAAGPPAGLRLEAIDDTAPPVRITAMQAFLVDNGIVPLSAAMLSGRIVPAVTRILVDARDAMAGCGTAFICTNAQSRHPGTAWLGLVAARPDLRGMGLGRFLCASILTEVGPLLDARGVVGMATEANVASRRMLEHLGLTPAPHRRVGVWTLSGAAFTR